MAESEEQQRSAERAGTPLLEWIVGAISGILVLAILAFVFAEGLVREDRPPDLQVRMDSVIAATDGYLLLFTVRNDGGETAAQVRVSGALRQGDVTIEESDAMLDYVPIAALRHGALQFQHNPEDVEVALRVTGFSEP